MAVHCGQKMVHVSTNRYEWTRIQVGREIQIERVSFNIFRGNIGILLGCST